MRKLFVLGLAALAMSGCANLKTLYGEVTSATVDPKVVYIAEQTFDGVETTATNYIIYCTPNPTPTACSDTAIQKIKPAIKAGRSARDSLVTFAKAHPGELGDKGVYDALVTATTSLQSIIAQYNIGAAK